MGMETVRDVDRDAEIYERYRTDLHRFATALVGPSDAPDVVSSVIVKTLSNHRLSDLRRPRSYLFQGVANESRSLFRGKARHREVCLVDSDSIDPTSEPAPEVLEAVAALPVQQRAATYLVYWLGCSTAEAAELMGVRPGTIGRYLYLARRHLRRILDED